jgi:hypothetical protein
MKRIAVLALASLPLFNSCELTDIITQLPTDTLTEAEAAQGLKDALSQGVTKGADLVSKLDGYFGNPSIKIPWPQDAVKIMNTLRDLGLNKLVDDVVLTINRAAEDAALKAKPIFITAIKELTIADAMDILFGADNAATEYLKRTTTNPLRAEFKPVIKTSLDKVNATKYWDDAVTTYNKIPLVTKMNPDLAEYVTGKAIDGLFFMVAKEEKKVREDPLLRATEMMKKVFGYRDRHK